MKYIATIGFFDGVHRGHLFLIQQLLQRAEQEHLSSMLITFDEHPRQVLEGQSPELLLTREEREVRLKQSGVRQVLEFTFSVIQNMTAEEFMRILHERCDVDVLLMGYDHRFGSDHLQDFEAYRQAGIRAGIQVEMALAQTSMATADNKREAPNNPSTYISSTAIRQALHEGRITDANAMLGYPYALTGTVVHGRHIGTELGFPTANLAVPADKLIPRQGVYAATCHLTPDTCNLQPDTCHLTPVPCLVNIGTNPTVGANLPLSIEVHIVGNHEDLYGQTLTIQLMAFIRNEIVFDNLQQLQQQIHTDLQHMEQLLSQHPNK